MTKEYDVTCKKPGVGAGTRVVVNSVGSFPNGESVHVELEDDQKEVLDKLKFFEVKSSSSSPNKSSSPKNDKKKEDE